ncbi:MAG: cation transporter [Bacteroidota bacterium]
MILTAMLLSFSLSAQEKNKKVTFEVDGVCHMCKARIEKAALKVKGVKFAAWDIPTHELSLVIDENKTNVMEIKTAVASVGHDTKELKAPKEAYDEINPCCKYRDPNIKHSGKH